MRLVLAALCGLLLCNGHAEELIDLPVGDSISYERFGTGGAPRVLLFPADEGFVEQELALARDLAASGFEVIYPRLHESYFLNIGPFSLSQVPLDDLVALVAAIDRADRPLLLIANQRVSVVALEVARAYQLSHPDRVPAGILLLSPYLEAEALQAGDALTFHPSAARSNLPLYLLQSRESSRIFQFPDTIAELEKGGSPVFYQVLPNTRDAFHIWPDEIWESEARERRRLPERIRLAFDLLRRHPAAPLSDRSAARGEARSRRVAALPQPIAGTPGAPMLGFTDLNGRRWDAAELRGKITLLNFWTTWCPPCVEELPSLRRLAERMRATDFRVVSVDLGEDRQTVESFLAQHRIELGYPVLLDPEGLSAKRWGVSALPTSFILDRAARVRYGLAGAIEWDSEEIASLVKSLLAE